MREGKIRLLLWVLCSSMSSLCFGHSLLTLTWWYGASALNTCFILSLTVKALSPTHCLSINVILVSFSTYWSQSAPSQSSEFFKQCWVSKGKGKGVSSPFTTWLLTQICSTPPRKFKFSSLVTPQTCLPVPSYTPGAWPFLRFLHSPGQKPLLTTSQDLCNFVLGPIPKRNVCFLISWI